MSLIGVVIILSFLIIIHELGHYIAARFAKIDVEEFGLGYPPRAKTLFSRWGTVFSLNWIPFGGFVRMVGEQAKPGDPPKKGEYYSASISKRLVVVLAGATVNFLFGILAFTLIFTVQGIPEPIDEARIGVVAPNSPAAQVGISPGVNILGFRLGEEFFSTPTTESVIDFVKTHSGQMVEVSTSGPCQGTSCSEMVSTYIVYLRTSAETPDDQGSLGVGFDSVVVVHYPWYEMPFRSAVYGVKQSLMMTGLIFQALGDLVQGVLRGQVPQDVAGPVGIVYQVEKQGLMKQGFAVALAFAGMLSINLAIMNVLPIPPLDGGRAVMTIVEKFVGRKRSEKVEYYLNYGGYILLLGLIVLITARDVWQILRETVLASFF